jgi:hypothetical protein
MSWRLIPLCAALLACASSESIETVPVEQVQRRYVLDVGPCEYQGTLHRSMRFDLDRELDRKKISLEQWTCLARALEAMDTGLRDACARGEAEARSVLLRREQQSAECVSPNREQQ